MSLSEFNKRLKFINAQPQNKRSGLLSRINERAFWLFVELKT